MEKKNEPKKKKKEKDKPKLTPRETISRERIRQIQKNAMGKMRRRLFAMGLTSIDDFK
jgi:DNA-directed RNA polymerase sigma subunit (sigma70/sigma32)